MARDSSSVPNARGIQIVALMVAGSVVFYAAIGTVCVKFAIVDLKPLIPSDHVSGLGLVLIMAAVCAAASSFPLRRLLAPRILAQEPGLAGRGRLAIVSMAVAEASGVIGVVYALLSGSLDVPFVLWGVSLAASIVHFPTRTWLEGRRGG